MANNSELPQWVAYLQALSVPVIALIGAWIGARQMLIANEKLKLDAFDRQYERRMEVYEATRSILEKVFSGELAEKDTRSYALHAFAAQFTFDEGMSKYLREVHGNVEGLRSARAMVDSNLSEDERAEYKRQSRLYLNWIIEQGAEKTGIAVLAPFLVQPPVKIPWLLRWP